MNYEKDTYLAYQNMSRAKAYRKQQLESLTWMRFTSWREKKCVAKALKRCNLKEKDYVLDMPCGTGILAEDLANIPSKVVAGDISLEMMQLAREEYKNNNFRGLIQADITQLPFRNNKFACVINLGFMHRVPAKIRNKALEEMCSLSNKYLIVTYSIDSISQQLKKWLIKKIKPNHASASSAAPLRVIREETMSHSLVIRKQYVVVYWLCAEIVILLEKKDPVIVNDINKSV